MMAQALIEGGWHTEEPEEEEEEEHDDDNQSLEAEHEEQETDKNQDQKIFTNVSLKMDGKKGASKKKGLTIQLDDDEEGGEGTEPETKEEENK